MAYDLLQIAPERDVPPFKPAWLVWAILFVVIVGGGAFCVVRFWPAREPANTLWFWTCALAFPLIGWLIPFLVYLGVLQVPQRRALDYNTARRQYLDQVCRKAGVPWHVLGSGFLFSAQEHENTAEAVAQRQLVREPQSRFAGDDEPVSARWIEPAGYTWLPGNEHADEERHRDMLPYVFAELLRQIAPSVRALPERTRLVVRLDIATLLSALEVETVWCDKWAELQLRATAKPEIGTTAPELIAADRWIDGKGVAVADAVALVCVVQFNPLQNAAPDAGSAEAGVILMFASSLLTARKQLGSKTLLFRPEQRDEKDLGQGLRQAMLWGRVKGPELKDLWMTGGAQAPLNRELANELDAQAVGVLKTENLSGLHDVDFQLGSAGIATPWLCVALAAERAQVSGRKQLLSTANDTRLTIAVVAPLP